MHKTLVVLVVGLTPDLLGPDTPRLNGLVERGGMRPLDTVTPAVTCSVQSTLVTGTLPSEHGAVANGWYFRDLKEVLLWRQPNNLVAGEKIWDAGKARDPNFTCANMFWWYNMYLTADWSATPRPMYPADGRKIPDHYAHPYSLHDELDAKLGQFPLFRFWGPAADITSSEWITAATLHVMETRQPTLTLTYLPHLDYNLQRLGPKSDNPVLQKDLRDIDACCGRLIDMADSMETQVIIVSEYGITAASDAIHINRALREAGFIAVRPEEHGREILDCGASAAFAMADHQIAHVYVNEEDRLGEVRRIVEGLDGVEAVWDAEGKARNGLDHPRSGELVAIAQADRWFSYYYWLEDRLAPDFARCVDIHRKPGYDPVELFLDPDLALPKLQTAWKLAKRKMGMRQLLDVISSSATHLVQGTHGRVTDLPSAGPLVISSEAAHLPEGSIDATDFKALVLDHIFDGSGSARDPL